LQVVVSSFVELDIHACWRIELNTVGCPLSRLVTNIVEVGNHVSDVM